MACDMVVALGRATADGRALFGHNSGRPAEAWHWLERRPGRSFAPGEKVRTQTLEVPQLRQTHTVLGSQSPGIWGYDHGVNVHGVAIGVTALRTRLDGAAPALCGTDLVRLGLERAASAQHAVHAITDLISRHGQADEGRDSALLIADAQEAFAVETSGRHWVCQEVREVRAMSDVCTIRQDWDRISPGLADQIIAHGWWPADGSKVDFAGALGAGLPVPRSALRRWGRAMLLLQEQNGHIDTAFLRRLLSDHFEGTQEEVDPLTAVDGAESLCSHGRGPGTPQTGMSLVAELGGEPLHLPLAWIAMGPPCQSVYFPVCLLGELPSPLSRAGAPDTVARQLSTLRTRLGRQGPSWVVARESLARLQARFDIEAEEFAAEGAGLQRDGKGEELARQATLFMQHCVELFEEVAAGLLDQPALARGWAGVV
jgi:dipeptidase